MIDHYRLKELVHRALIDYQESAEHQLSDTAQTVIESDIEAFWGTYVSANLPQQVDEIHANPRLSEQGKQEAIAKVRAEALHGLFKIVDRLDVADSIQRLEADLVNRAAQAREKNTPADSAMKYLQDRELRDYLFRVRDEHDRKLNAPDQQAFLSDEERNLDPVASLFIAACDEYGPDKEALIRAATAPPWPMSFLEADTIAHGTKLLQRAVSPEIAQKLDETMLRQRCQNIVSKALEDELTKGMTPAEKQEAITQ